MWTPPVPCQHRRKAEVANVVAVVDEVTGGSADPPEVVIEEFSCIMMTTWSMSSSRRAVVDAQRALG